MTRLARALHLDDGEFPALRAEIESKPLPAKLRVGVRTPRPPLPLGAPARSVAVLAGIRAEAPVALFDALNAPPLLQVDFAAWLADDWTHVNARLDNLDDATARDLTQAKARYQYGTHVATAPLLSELVELKAVTLVNWRQALRVHAEDELALYDAKAQVA